VSPPYDNGSRTSASVHLIGEVAICGRSQLGSSEGRNHGERPGRERIRCEPRASRLMLQPIRSSAAKTRRASTRFGRAPLTHAAATVKTCSISGEIPPCSIRSASTRNPRASTRWERRSGSGPNFYADVLRMESRKSTPPHRDRDQIRTPFGTFHGHKKESPAIPHNASQRIISHTANHIKIDTP
jgi:hypothetical protein